MTLAHLTDYSIDSLLHDHFAYPIGSLAHCATMVHNILPAGIVGGFFYHTSQGVFLPLRPSSHTVKFFSPSFEPCLIKSIPDLMGWCQKSLEEWQLKNLEMFDPT